MFVSVIIQCRPVFKIRDLAFHDFRIKRTVLHIGKDFYSAFAAGTDKRQHPFVILFFILPAHTFVVTAVQHVQAEVCHGFSTFFGIIPVMPVIQPQSSAVNSAGGWSADAAVHRGGFMVAEGPEKTVRMLHNVHNDIFP